jgi:predicted nicotinamide N-methyase
LLISANQAQKILASNFLVPKNEKKGQRENHKHDMFGRMMVMMYTMLLMMTLLKLAMSSTTFLVVAPFEIQNLHIQKQCWQQPRRPRPASSHGHRQPLLVLRGAKRRSKQIDGDSVGQQGDAKNKLKPLAQASVPKSSQTRPVVFAFDLLAAHNQISISSLYRPPNSVLHVTAVQVKDPAWWNENNNALVNPYGARLWPSSYAIAQFLASYLSTTAPPSRSALPVFVLELGCGVGLVSLVAAAAPAAARGTAATTTTTVVATDISPMALSLTQQGWMATNKKRNNENGGADTTNGAEQAVKQQGSFSTMIFDIFSSKPLPLLAAAAAASPESSRTLVNSTQNPQTNETPPLRQQPRQQRIVVAGAMLYDANLAAALARRVVEAVYAFDAWVIVGDDDSGERDGGRAIFLQEMERHQQQHQQKNLSIPMVQTQGVVRHAGLGWSEKRVSLLHFNAPPNAIQIVEVQG